MTEHPVAFWKDEFADARFSDPAACSLRATRFETTIRRRNLIEYAAAVLVILSFGAASVLSAQRGEWAIAVTFAMTIAAAVFVVAKLRRDGSMQQRRPETSCRDHLRAQLVRQRDLLRGVPKWYLAPFVPGLLCFYYIVTARVAQAHGWQVALEGIWVQLAATAIFFAFVAWLNLFAARRIDREIAALDVV